MLTYGQKRQLDDENGLKEHLS